jgi:predicted dehydrogenase
MTLAEADRIVTAVKEAGVRFMSFDASWRFNPLYTQTRAWLQPTELGRPLSVFAMMRSSLPTLTWFGDPPEHGRTWWLDLKQSPGGGWIDHGIYYIDVLRWLFGAEVTRVSGEIANLKHPNEQQEDFGVGTFVFENGVVAAIEVTWTIESAGFATAFQLVGSNGQLLAETTPADQQQSRSLKRIAYGASSPGWQNVEVKPAVSGLTSHMVAVLRGEAEPIANEDDSYATLAACFAFYQAAREHCSVTP